MPTEEHQNSAAGHPLVFVIEDDDIQRRGLARFLVREGFTVREFVDGESALSDVKAAGPDLVVCDYRLPGRNGLEVMSEMKGKGNAGFILISAYLTDELRNEARAAGFAVALEKPVSLDLFLNECRSAVGPCGGNL